MLAIGRDPVLAGAGWAGDDKGVHDFFPLVKKIRMTAMAIRNKCVVAPSLSRYRDPAEFKKEPLPAEIMGNETTRGMVR